MSEIYEIGFDDDIEVVDNSLHEGLYSFTYLGYVVGSTEVPDKETGELYPTGIAQLSLKNLFKQNAKEATRKETFIMNTKWQWKLNQFWRSLGHEVKIGADGKKKVSQGWETDKGRGTGIVEVVKTPDKNDKTKSWTNLNFIAPEDVEEKKEEWSKKLGVQLSAHQATTAIWNGWGK